MSDARPAAAGRPRVLVLLATFDGAAHLEAQLRSLERQRGVELDLRVSDDGSTDGTPAILGRIRAEGALRIELLPTRPGTGSAARNFLRLLREVEVDGADYLALCDQDDVWRDDKLLRAATELARTGADAYSADSLAFFPSGRETRIRKAYPQRPFDPLFESASHGCTYVLTARTARAFQAWLRTDPPALDRIEFHDWLLYAWARSRGLRWHMDPTPTIRYRQTGQNVIGANAGPGAVRRRLGLLRSGWLGRQAVAIAEAVGWGDRPIVARLRRMRPADRLWIALHAGDCRRRPRDRWVLAAVCLFFGL